MAMTSPPPPPPPPPPTKVVALTAEDILKVSKVLEDMSSIIPDEHGLKPALLSIIGIFNQLKEATTSSPSA
jgi:hypothetical protein